MALIKVRCQCCGELRNWDEKDAQRSEYYKSSSIINKATGRLSVCKFCVIDFYSSFLEKSNDNPRLSVYLVCRLLDIYFEEKLFLTILQKENKEMNSINILTSYIRQVNSLKQYKGKCFADSDFIQDIDNLQQCVMFDEGFTVTKEMVDRWGNGLPSADYKFLEKQFATFLPRIDLKNDIQLMYVEDICRLRLEADKARRTNKLADYDKLMRTISGLMEDAKLKPMQEETDAIKLSFGEWIAKIENEEPIPEASPEFKDVDGIMKYISKWFTNQVGVMLGAVPKDEIDIVPEETGGEKNE